ncbi:MAG: DNA polymerase I [bacterium]|nr:DNA polymerase I [bacterium]
MKKLVIIDGKSVFYRGYYAMSNLTTTDGTPTGGVYGFASLAFEVIRKLKPDYVVVAWDKKGTSTARRSEIYPEYKAGRKKAPDDFYEQIPLLKDFLEALGWPLFECDGYEADDILGTLAVQANKLGIEADLITSDLDMLQLIDSDTKVFAMKRGFSEIEEFDLKYFEEKYGLKQAQFLDLKALQGDSSDNIPGVPGIGPKTATTLLQEFFTLENIYKNLDKIKPSWRSKLEAGKESAFMSKKIAEIWLNAPVELNLKDADIHNFDYQKVLVKLREFEFNSLVRKIPAEMKQGTNTPENPDQTNLFENLESQKSNNLLPELNLHTHDNMANFLAQSDRLFIINYENKIYYANNEQYGFYEISEYSVTDLEQNFLHDEIILFDIKQHLHDMSENGIFYSQTDKFYDLRQMEFLLNPLIRDKSLSGILEQEINEKDPIECLRAMIYIYNRHQKQLENLPKIRKIAKNLDFPMASVIFKMERTGVEINPDFFAEESQIFGEKIAKIETEIFELAGTTFNVASPLQLSKVLFENLALPTKGIKKSRTGFSTGQKELDKLRGLHSIIEKIEQFREFSKLKNTYIDTLPKLADEQNRIHSTFHQDVTSTGRLSSTNPNLQNIPIRSELGRKLRAGFVPKEGNILIAADYSQFELRLAAVMAGDQKLIEDFRSGADIHLKTAAMMFNLPENEISTEQRRAAKVINFGVLYGMSAHRLASELKINFAEAKSFIDNYFEVRKPIQNFINKTIKQAEEQGFVETLLGRRRPTPDVKSSNFMIREAAKRAAANMPIQGTEADLMKRAMIEVDKKITRAGLGEQILQIHDSILIEAPIENAEQVSKILREIMEQVCPELDIPLKVDVKIGKSWEAL